MKLNLFSLESGDEVIETKNQETEITIYAKISNFDGLKEATEVKSMIQVEAQLGESNHCRVRKLVDESKNIFTFKVNNGNHNSQIDSRQEENLDVSDSFYENFLKVADKLQNKTRYTFNTESIKLSYKENDEDKIISVPDVLFEVDVYKKEDGSFSEYCKIDLEVDNILTFINHNYPEIKDIKLSIKISELPFKPTDAVITDKSDPKITEFINSLYSTEFCVDLRKQRADKIQDE